MRPSVEFGKGLTFRPPVWWRGTIATSFVVTGVAWAPGSTSARALIDMDGDRLVQASHSAVAASPSFEIRQTLEQRAAVLVAGKLVDTPKTPLQVSLIEVDQAHDLMRLTAREPGGRDITAIRRGSQVAIQLGSEPWQVPNGSYATIAKQLANPFACPLPVPGLDSPRWEIVTTEGQGDDTTIIVRTAADSAVGFAQKQMTEGLNSLFPDPGTRPTIQVLDYVSRQWIRKKDNRRLKVVQASRQRMTLRQPNGAATVLGVTATTTAVYGRYGEVRIVVPEQARHILATAGAPDSIPSGP